MLIQREMSLLVNFLNSKISSLLSYVLSKLKINEFIYNYIFW